MCHHSLPSLITPIENKTKVSSILAADYSLIATFYLLLSFTGIFAFASVPDLYTLAFKPDGQSSNNIATEIADYLLALFPVFTLSTNFPIIAITLRNNLGKPSKNILIQKNHDFWKTVFQVSLCLILQSEHWLKSPWLYFGFKNILKASFRGDNDRFIINYRQLVPDDKEADFPHNRCSASCLGGTANRGLGHSRINNRQDSRFKWEQYQQCLPISGWNCFVYLYFKLSQNFDQELTLVLAFST